tara:strand:- start:487 stop:714 length:228 start_codon:yes stop_codon:yes gene_type:complete
MDDSSVVGVLAEALAQHQLRRFGYCTCPWSAGVDTDWEAEHVAHVASVVAALPNIAITEVPSAGYKAEGGQVWEQ